MKYMQLGKLQKTRKLQKKLFMRHKCLFQLAVIQWAYINHIGGFPKICVTYWESASTKGGEVDQDLQLLGGWWQEPQHENIEDLDRYFISSGESAKKGQE